MNMLLIVGLLVITGYFTGRLLEKMTIPKIIGYILVGIVFSPNSMDWMPAEIITGTDALLSVSLAFITFEIGGELKWSKIKKLERQIVGITLFESLTPVFLVTGGLYLTIFLVPDLLPFASSGEALPFVILLAALASPTDPTATLAVIHQFKARGTLKDTILGVAALDDSMGIILFSISIGLSSFLLGVSGDMQGALLVAGVHVGGGIAVGVLAALVINLFLRYLKVESEGHWIIIIFSLISLCYGTASALDLDALLACMVMGVVVVNTSRNAQVVFRILERYTEELIFLFFFVLSGLHLNIQQMPPAVVPIMLFVILRMMGKYGGSYLGASLAGASAPVRKNVGGGLIPQGGVVIGLVLLLNRYPQFDGFFELLLAVVMGAAIINELIGPLTAKYALVRAKETEL
ncbi:cation:proton antiporter [Fodinibius sediminis]|uniref:Transporter, CPA2 family n=1 Tax=Fodinibius sediminis TaxID=1214077 RepID=A0A521CH02_9BACT|nr:cation:proton antiporter [Fodinibius sediminis]SMO58625.1 transporter, CPA2 family [Fodinibius sediminis]